MTGTLYIYAHHSVTRPDVVVYTISQRKALYFSRSLWLQSTPAALPFFSLATTFLTSMDINMHVPIFEDEVSNAVARLKNDNKSTIRSRFSIWRF